MDTIGRYEVIQKLGAGATAVVYLAHDPYTKRQVAVKVMGYGHVDDPLFSHFFHQEAQAIAALDHPAIAPVYDFGVQGEQLYMVTRYLAGGTLLDQLRLGVLPLPEVEAIMQRLAGALDEAHGREIIHRDVKPSNVLYDQEGQAYLSDFGLAKFTRRSSNLTQNLFVGTVQYMSPEHLRGQPLDGRTDVYALGVLLFECLTRRLPYPYKEPVQAAKAALREPIPSVQSLNAALPTWWDEIIQKALAKDRNERYQTAVALANDVTLAVKRRWHLRALE